MCGLNMKLVLTLLLTIPIFVFANETKLSCDVQETKNSCLNSGCTTDTSSGFAELNVIHDNFEDIHILGITLRYKTAEWFFTNIPTEENYKLINFRNDDKKWLIVNEILDEESNTTWENKIEIDRFTGKLYLKRKMTKDKEKNIYIIGTYMGDCKKDNEQKQKF